MFCTYLFDAVISGDEHVEHAVLDDVEVVSIVSLPDQVLAGLGAFLEHRVQHLRKPRVKAELTCWQTESVYNILRVLLENFCLRFIVYSKRW